MKEIRWLEVVLLGTCLCLSDTGAACAQESAAESDETSQEQDEADAALDGTAQLALSPFSPETRYYYYQALWRSPAKALLWDLALPGAGSFYTGIYANTIVAASLSLIGAGLWIAGAVRDNDALWWSGAGTFAAGRVYGLVSAPLGAALLNAAFRRHFGLAESDE